MWSYEYDEWRRNEYGRVKELQNQRAEWNVLYCSVKRSGMPAVRWRDEDLELPDIMVPHKHYSRSAIIDTINGERNCSAEQSTIYRWNREKMQLERLLVQVEDKSPEAKRTDGDNNCRCAGN